MGRKRAAVVGLLAGLVAMAVTVGVMAMLTIGLFTSPFGLALAAGTAVTVGAVVAAMSYLVKTIGR